MCKGFYSWLATAVLALLWTAIAAGQNPPPPPPSPPTLDRGPSTPAAQAAIAATVDNETIPERALQRALQGIPPARQAEARPEILNFLIDNAVVDHYLIKIPIVVDKKEVDAKMSQIQDEITKEGRTFEKLMQDLVLTEAELREKIAAELRWEKFAQAQATDKALRDLFDQNHDMFDGSLVSARHILLTPGPGDARGQEQAKAKLLELKKGIEEEVARGLAKLPPQSDNLAREKARAELIEEAFAAVATKESACPSKTEGGNLGYFPRAGNMVEAFARTAFSLKPYSISEVVATPFGFHLILVTDHKPGRDVKFEDVKNQVKEVYIERLRETLASRLRPSAKITINPPPKM
jgi:peptidyl-prolyl cis-trans isomerase C